MFHSEKPLLTMKKIDLMAIFYLETITADGAKFRIKSDRKCLHTANTSVNKLYNIKSALKQKISSVKLLERACWKLLNKNNDGI